MTCGCEKLLQFTCQATTRGQHVVVVLIYCLAIQRFPLLCRSEGGCRDNNTIYIMVFINVKQIKFFEQVTKLGLF